MKRIPSCKVALVVVLFGAADVVSAQVAPAGAVVRRGVDGARVSPPGAVPLPTIWGSLLPTDALTAVIPFDPLGNDLSKVRGVNYIPGFASSSVTILSPRPEPAALLPQIELDLWNLRNAGVNTIRFWLNFWSWYDDSTYYLSALQLVFARCSQWGIYVIPVLWDADFEPPCGLETDPTCTAACNAIGPCFTWPIPLSNPQKYLHLLLIPNPVEQFAKWPPNPGGYYIFYGPKFQEFAGLFSLYAANVVAAIKDSPALLIWDIMNEPLPDYQPLHDWLIQMIAGVRYLDTNNHKITAGVALARHQSALVNQLDVLSFHPYSMLKEGYTQHFNEAWSMAANGRNGRIPILATEGPGGPGFGMRYEDFLSWTYATQCGVTIFEGMVHYGPPAAYPYQVKSGFLYKDGWARDLGTINMLRYLAGQQNGYAGTNQINEKLQTTYPGYPANGWVPFYPLGEGVWSGVGGAEIVTLLRNWSGASPPNYGNPYPKLTPTSNIPTADAYAAIFSGVFGDCVWLNRVSQAESLQFNGYLSAYDTAAKNGNWQAAEDQLQINMLPKLLQWMNVNPPITYASQL